MNNEHTTIDPQELNKFAQHASVWWDINGPLKTLHDINPVRLDFIKQHCGDLNGLNILDVGCGGGILTEGLAVEEAHVTGIDATQAAIDSAISHAGNHKLDIQYVCTPVEHYDADAFDVITCMELLEHVPHPELVIEHCSRLLKSGGLLFLSTINRTLKAYAGAILVAEYFLQLLPRQTHDFEKFIAPGELVSMARRAGLELIDLKGLSYNPLSRHAATGPDVSINYLAAFRKI